MRSQNIRAEHIKQFRKHARALSRLIESIQSYNPEASLYNTPRMLHLMSGPTHDESHNPRPLHENITDSVPVSTLSGGDW